MQKLLHANEYLAPPHNPEWYPGQRPRSHYIVTPQQRILLIKLPRCIRKLHEATVSWDGERRKLNDLLREWGEAQLEERIPVAAYGANRGPVRLIAKLKNEDRSIVVPTIKGEVRGGVVLYDSFMWRNGHFASQINLASELSSKKLRKTPTVECWINLLSKEQINALHDAQKVEHQKHGYYLAEVPWTFHRDTIDVYAYCSTLPCVVMYGKYVRFASNRYKGKDKHGRTLLPNKDFAPINIQYAGQLDKTIEKCQIEVMEHMAQLVMYEFGVELYEPIGGKHAYRITKEAAEIKPEINEYFVKIGKTVRKRYPKVKNPYNIKVLKDLL